MSGTRTMDSRLRMATLRLATRLHDFASDCHSKLVRWQSEAVGSGITNVLHIHDDGRSTSIYDVDTLMGMIRWVFGYTNWEAVESPTQTQLLKIRYIQQGRVRSALVRSSLEDLRSLVGKSLQPSTRIIAMYLNDVNISSQIPLITGSMFPGNRLTVSDITAYLLACRTLSGRDIIRLVNRNGELKLQLVDSHLEQNVFAGDQLVALPAATASDGRTD